MRLGRAKASRKTLKFYSINAGITAPYKIILDGNFLAAIVKQKVQGVIFERLERLLSTHKFTVYTTRSALEELNALPGEVFEQARQFGLDDCEIIERKDIGTSTTADAKQPADSDSDSNAKSNPKQDIIQLVQNGNPDKWLVATQDESLADKIRSMPNVPQMRLARAILILESPSSSSRRNALYEEKGKQSTGGGTMTNEEKELLDRLRDEKMRKRQRSQTGNGSGYGARDDETQRKRHKAKGPNPLSCKKKKGESVAKTEGKKRNRRKKTSS